MGRRWNGWGDKGLRLALGAASLADLREHLGVSTPPIDARRETALASVPERRPGASP